MLKRQLPIVGGFDSVVSQKMEKQNFCLNLGEIDAQAFMRAPTKRQKLKHILFMFGSLRREALGIKFIWIGPIIWVMV